MAPDWARRSRCWRRVSGDEDTIAAVGEPIKGLRNTAQWAADLDNPANRKFVEDFKKTYKRMPTLYAPQGYDAAMLLDSAVRQTGGKLDADTLRPALRRADFKSVRGDFKFNRNQYPIQNYYLRIIEAGADGKPANKLSGTVLTQYQDPFAASCQME